jgi:hypothetical protein
VQGQDEWDQWGTPAAVTVVVDKTAPVTSAITLNPQATNGLVGSPNKPGNVIITATITDPITGGVASSVTGVEGYLDSVRPAGDANGLYFSPIGGGQWTTDMPLAWLASKKSDGPVTIYVVGTDAAGNRSIGAGATESTSLNLDRTKPVVGLSLAQGTGYLANRTLTGTVTANDTTAAGGSGIVYAEYFVGADPGPGRATRVTTLGLPAVGPVTGTFTYDLFAHGFFTPTALKVTFRVKDAAGNWSQTTTPFTTQSLLVFSNGFEPNTLGAWNLGSVGPVGFATTTPTGRIAGQQSLLVGVRPAAFYAVGLAMPAYAGQALTSMHASFSLRTLAASTGCATGTNTATCLPNGASVLTAYTGGSNVLVVQIGRAAPNRAARFRVGIRVGGSIVYPGGATQGWVTVGGANATSFTVAVDWSSATRQAVVRVNGGRAITSVRGSAGATIANVAVGSTSVDPFTSTGSLSFDNVAIA